MNPRKVEKNDMDFVQTFPATLIDKYAISNVTIGSVTAYLSDSGMQACACSFVRPIRGNSVCFYSEWHSRGLK